MQCFSAILSWSRVRIWWFGRSVDREHTFEGLVRFFEHVGGVPKVLRTDRMGALGPSQGRRFTLHPPALAFAQFHGTEIRACQARDAKRKGKVERPFRDLKERFLEECAATGAPKSVAELNERAAVLARPSASTPGATAGPVTSPPSGWWSSRSMLAPLPRRRFDTAYVEARRVHVAIPQIEWQGVRYSVPPRCLGQRVEVRQEVDADTIEVRWAGEVVARHTLADPAQPARSGTPGTSRPPRKPPWGAAGAATWRSSCPRGATRGPGAPGGARRRRRRGARPRPL